MNKFFGWIVETIDWYGRWTSIKAIWLTLSSPAGGIAILPIIFPLNWPIWSKVLVVMYSLTFLPIVILFIDYLRSGPLRLVLYDGESIQCTPINDDLNVMPLQQGNRKAVSITVNNFSSKNTISNLSASITEIVPHPYCEEEKLCLPQRLMFGNKGTAEKVFLHYKEPVAIQLFSYTDAFVGYQDLRMGNLDGKSFFIEEDMPYQVTVLINGQDIKPLKVNVLVIRQDRDFTFRLS